MKIHWLGYRQKLIIVIFLLTSLFAYGLTLTDFYSRLYFLFPLFIFTFLGSLIMFWHYRRLIGFWFVFLIPFYILAGGLLFEMVLPSLLVFHLLEIFLIFVLIYAAFLSSNIFLVSSRRTIKLYQAALGITLFLLIISIFLAMDALLAFRFSPWLNSLITFILVFPLSLYVIWVVDLSPTFKKIYLYYASIFSLLVAEGTLAISFWPTPLTVKAIFVAALVYALAGLYQAHFLEKVFKQTEEEFWWLIVLVAVSVFLVTRWG